MTYSDAIQFLYDLRWFGAKLGLANTRKLAALAGNPQDQLRFVHVAGTNGKGSTCAMLESVYRTGGLRVGLFTSPHLVSFGERIQVNRRSMSKADIARLVAELRPLLRQFPAVEHPTFFEVVTVMALRYFAAHQCDLVVWETGLGGRLDATNIVTPLGSIITNIQFDHQQWLGETLAGIAAEKAGIIKRHRPVITGADAPEALRVIAEKAREQSAPLTLVTAADTERPPLDQVQLPLLGRHQRMNAAVAIAAVRALRPEIPVSDDTLCAGLAHVHWAGRLQLVTVPFDRRGPGGPEPPRAPANTPRSGPQTAGGSGRELLLDGAHNVGGAEMLAAALQEYFPLAKPTLVLGILRDKDWAAMCGILAPLAGRILLAPVHSERTASPGELAAACRRANPQAAMSEHASLKGALAAAEEDGFVTIAGSLYLIGEAMELLQLSPAKATQERGLNEWMPGPRRLESAVLP